MSVYIRSEYRSFGCFTRVSLNFHGKSENTRTQMCYFSIWLRRVDTGYITMRLWMHLDWKLVDVFRLFKLDNWKEEIYRMKLDFSCGLYELEMALKRPLCVRAKLFISTVQPLEHIYTARHSPCIVITIACAKHVCIVCVLLRPIEFSALSYLDFSRCVDLFAWFILRSVENGQHTAQKRNIFSTPAASFQPSLYMTRFAAVFSYCCCSVLAFPNFTGFRSCWFIFVSRSVHKGHPKNFYTRWFMCSLHTRIQSNDLTLFLFLFYTHEPTLNM